jgi:hypothetical protein
MRIAALALAVVALVPATASAAPVRLTVAVETTVAAQQVPPTVDAAWSFTTQPAYRLQVSGKNLPGAESTVTASWSGTERADSRGRLVQVEHAYVYGAFGDGATADLTVDYRVGTRWYRAVTMRLGYLGSAPLLTNEAHDLLVVRAPSVAGRTVPVRVNVTVRYGDAAYRIDDAFVVRAP